MKANELRIGNLIYQWRTDIPFEVGIDDLKIIQSGESKARPIPLTEEWLFKFGYDLISENHYGILGHLIWKIEGRFYCDKNGMQLKYVHQLQNIYFALTNQELEIKM